MAQTPVRIEIERYVNQQLMAHGIAASAAATESQDDLDLVVYIDGETARARFVLSGACGSGLDEAVKNEIAERLALLSGGARLR